RSPGCGDAHSRAPICIGKEQLVERRGPLCVAEEAHHLAGATQGVGPHHVARYVAEVVDREGLEVPASGFRLPHRNAVPGHGSAPQRYLGKAAARLQAMGRSSCARPCCSRTRLRNPLMLSSSVSESGIGPSDSACSSSASHSSRRPSRYARCPRLSSASQRRTAWRPVSADRSDPSISRSAAAMSPISKEYPTFHICPSAPNHSS